MMRAVRIKGLSLSRGERALFSGLDLDLENGDAVALTGRNGAGKTSLLRAVAGLLRPQAGTIDFEGSEGRILEAEAARADHLHLAGHHDGLKSARTAGQRRRVSLARLLASPRRLWLLDEPMAPLDAAHRKAFGSIMAEHLAKGGMVLAAVHDPLPVPARLVEIGA